PLVRHAFPRACLLPCVDQGAEESPEESRRGLIGRPEGRARRERVLKDAAAPPSFKTDPAALGRVQPARSPVATPQRPLQRRASLSAQSPIARISSRSTSPSVLPDRFRT